MELTLSRSGWPELFAEVGQQLGTPRRIERFGVDLSWPSATGRGSVRYRTLRPGLTLFVLDLELRAPLLLDVQSGPRSIEFGFSLAGRGQYHLRGVPGRIATAAGSGGLAFAPDLAATAAFPADQRLTIAELHLTPEALGHFFIDADSPLPAPLDDLLGEHAPAPITHRLAITPAMQIALRQLLDCLYTGATARLYQEGKALELIALATAGLQQRSACAPVPLRPDDVERLHRARAVLEATLDEPPSLLALARLVGVNDHKLKGGFRQLFGTTVFGYLHERRMARARELLLAREMSIGEVAGSVGYANPSKFAAAFKRAHGVAPSDYHARSYASPGPIPISPSIDQPPHHAPSWSEKTPAWSGAAAETALP